MSVLERSNELLLRSRSSALELAVSTVPCCEAISQTASQRRLISFPPSMSSALCSTREILPRVFEAENFCERHSK